MNFKRWLTASKPNLGSSGQPDASKQRPYSPEVSDDALTVKYSIAGKKKRTHYTFYRGENTNFLPDDNALSKPEFISEFLAKGLMPERPLIDKKTAIAAFGSCFASNIKHYLRDRDYNVITRGAELAYISRMGDGIVNSYAIRQQFEWAWESRQPSVDLWHDYDAKTFGYDEEIRRETKAIFDRADAFILTYGLSEIWFDEPTGEVFWRAVPYKHFNPARHKFRVASCAENLANIQAIHKLIRTHRPDAAIIQTLSPIALTATFRREPCMVANAASKAILRAALDEFYRTTDDEKSFYFPSYEVVLQCFRNSLMEDRKHVHKFALEFNMKLFERYFCDANLTDGDLTLAFKHALEIDEKVGREGHFSVDRSREVPKP